jgi:hypothetical protein
MTFSISGIETVHARRYDSRGHGAIKPPLNLLRQAWAKIGGDRQDENSGRAKNHEK